MSTKAETLEERFQARLSAMVAGPTYNAAPSQAQLTILSDNPQTIVRTAWGFVPGWAEGRSDVKPLINARAETAATKPFFRTAFKSNRCLVLADGFYEWQRTKGGKRPYRIALKTEEPFAFAGLWSTIHDANGQPHPTFAILTTAANGLVAQIHHRMPIILREELEKEWLNPGLSQENTQEFFTPYPAEMLTMYEVSTKVNSPAYNTPEAIRAIVHETSESSAWA
jgi:putative SOS response-associated peptidase YedK